MDAVDSTDGAPAPVGAVPTVLEESLAGVGATTGVGAVGAGSAAAEVTPGIAIPSRTIASLEYQWEQGRELPFQRDHPSLPQFVAVASPAPALQSLQVVERAQPQVGGGREALPQGAGEHHRGHETRERAEAGEQRGRAWRGHAEGIEAREHQDPQEVGVALHALAEVEFEGAVLGEVAGVAERDERVVAQEFPGARVHDEGHRQRGREGDGRGRGAPRPRAGLGGGSCDGDAS